MLEDLQGQAKIITSLLSTVSLLAVLLLKGDPSLTDAPQLHSCVCCDFTLKLPKAQVLATVHCASGTSHSARISLGRVLCYALLLVQQLFRRTLTGSALVVVAFLCHFHCTYRALGPNSSGGKLQHSALACHTTCVFERKTWTSYGRNSGLPNALTTTRPTSRLSGTGTRQKRSDASRRGVLKTRCLPLRLKHGNAT